MQPSPRMRVSRGREVVAENHKRGHSLESGINYRKKDNDDLALFNEMQNKEKDNFLLQSNDDFDDIFARKLRSFSDYKLGISIPAQGESSDLLNTEGDKNDYDWLITPPETPLFSSLDDETQPVKPVPRGRPRSQHVSISRSPSMEKGYISGRGNASPHRLSSSPQSSTSTLQSRNRPFSATHSSPPPTSRHSPSRGLSPPPSKSSPVPISNTPAPRRMSTGSAIGITTPSRVRGTSPIETSRGNSASPKLRAWQSNIPGFSLEAPPNLRTSLADRPASYVRGSSPASRNGSRSGRQSMSPTASRSVSSSHSHENLPFSSRSKGSVASSGDDDLDSLHSTPVSSSSRSAPRSIGAFPSSKTLSFSKKPSPILSSSVPKRSFDMALRHMERKGSQNMFRPLLSSVPSSTFYAGKSSAQHRSLVSRNSSITTSSNASSDQGTSGPLDIEESEQNQEDVTSNHDKGQHDNVFVMDQADGLNEDGIIKELTFSRLDEVETKTSMDASIVILDTIYDHSVVEGNPDILLCSKCCRGFPSCELVMEKDIQLCLECTSSEIDSSTLIIPLEHEPSEIFYHSAPVPELSEAADTGETGTESTNYIDNTTNEGPHLYIEPSQNLTVFGPQSSSEPTQNPAIRESEEGEPTFGTHQINHKIIDPDTGNNGTCPNSKVDSSEGAGISLLLKQSSSGKRHIVQSRSFTASNTSYDDFSFVTESVNSMRSSIRHSSASVSSSVDLGSSRQMETRIYRQLSGRKSDIENYRHEIPAKHKRSSSSLSGASGHVLLAPSVDPQEQLVASEIAEEESTCTDAQGTSINRTADSPNVDLGDTSLVSILASEYPESYEDDRNLTSSSINLMNTETSSAHLHTSTGEEDATLSLRADEVDLKEIPGLSSLDVVLETEIVNADIVSTDSQFDADSTKLDSCMDEIVESYDLDVHIDVGMVTVEEFNLSDSVHDVIEESTVVLKDLGGTKARSLTLEEATDTILFCSSIVHNLAYKAANIAIEKENSPMKVLQPTLTFIDKSNSDRRELRSRTIAKRSSKSQKARQKKVETDTKFPPVLAESDGRSSPHIVRDPSKGDTVKQPTKLESKCNCTIM